MLGSCPSPLCADGTGKAWKKTTSALYRFMEMEEAQVFILFTSLLADEEFSSPGHYPAFCPAWFPMIQVMGLPLGHSNTI